jgi:AraC-like DNA-binding protein
VDDAAHRVSLSLRQLRRCFDDHVGLPPKTLQTILRFNRFRAWRPASGQVRPPLARAAAECGYYDQAHLCRDCARLAGVTPTLLLAGRRPGFGYRGSVSSERVPGGVVHKLPADLRKALIANTTALGAWTDITPLARNEFICWVEDAKQETTRERRIRRTQEELEEGQRRPCCWPGCSHRERNGR